MLNWGAINNTKLPVEVLILSMSDIESLLTYQDAIASAEDVYKACGNNQVVSPDKVPLYMDSPDNQNFITPMTGLLKDINVAGVKWVSAYFKHQPGVPAVWGSVIILNNAENGQPFAILDGTVITNVRTAAHVAVAAKYLARNDSKTVAMIGCGAEARTHCVALKELFPIKQIKAYDIIPEAVVAYKKEMEHQFDIQVSHTPTPRKAVESADIVCMTSTAPEPIVFESWISPGAFVSGITGFLDLDPNLSQKADKWVVGYKKADAHFDEIFAHSGVDYSKSYAEMGQIVTAAKAGRETPVERIVYTHFGMGVHDICLASRLYNKAIKQGLGQKIKLI